MSIQELLNTGAIGKQEGTAKIGLSGAKASIDTASREAPTGAALNIGGGGSPFADKDIISQLLDAIAELNGGGKGSITDPGNGVGGGQSQGMHMSDGNTGTLPSPPQVTGGVMSQSQNQGMTMMG